MGAKQHRPGKSNASPTAAQRRAQADMRTLAAAWNALSEEQRLAWGDADRTNRRGGRANLKRHRSGRRLFTKVSQRRLALGLDLLQLPPGLENCAPHPLLKFHITNCAGRIRLQLTVIHGDTEGVMLASFRPLNAGVMKWNKFVRLGLLPAPVVGTCDITRLYAAKYGVPPVGKKVFIRLQQMKDYLGSLVQVLSAVVPPPAASSKSDKTPHSLAKP